MKCQRFSAVRGLAMAIALLLATAAAASAQPYPFQNPNLPPDQRIDNLLSLMTADEKIDALGMISGVPAWACRASAARRVFTAWSSGALRSRDAGHHDDPVPPAARHGCQLGPGTRPPGRRGAGSRGALHLADRRQQAAGADGAGARRPTWRATRAGGAARRSTARIPSSTASCPPPSPAGCRGTTRSTGRPRRF